VLELQNGCACCSASEELLSSVMKLLLVSAEREEPYDRIIIEMSGVAEPKNIRKQVCTHIREQAQPISIV